jgi:hypothetical protein
VTLSEALPIARGGLCVGQNGRSSDLSRFNRAFPAFQGQWQVATNFCINDDCAHHHERELQQRVLSGILTPFPFCARSCSDSSEPGNRFGREISNKSRLIKIYIFYGLTDSPAAGF